MPPLKFSQTYPKAVVHNSALHKPHIWSTSSQTKKKEEKSKEIRTGASGALPKIFSIFSKTSRVNFGITSSALRFCLTCSGFDAPRITVDVLGFLATHARARALTVVLSSAASNLD